MKEEEEEEKERHVQGRSFSLFQSGYGVAIAIRFAFTCRKAFTTDGEVPTAGTPAAFSIIAVISSSQPGPLKKEPVVQPYASTSIWAVARASAALGIMAFICSISSSGVLVLSFVKNSRAPWMVIARPSFV